MDDERVVALLRGVNVGGRPLRMADLRARLTEVGCGDVATYVQSGNVVLSLPEGRGGAWLSREISDLAGFEVLLTVRTHAELDELLRDSPYPEAGGTQAHVLFCEDPPDAWLAEVDLEPPGGEEATVVGRDIWMHLPDGMGRADLPVQIGRAATRARAFTTARNLNTVRRLREMSAQDG